MRSILQRLISSFVPHKFVFASCILLFSGLVGSIAHAKGENGALLKIVQSSCTKACLNGRGDKAFCTAYCGCVSGRVEKLAERSDISKVLQSERQQEVLIHQCSGETAVKFFAKSCQKKCNGAPKCNGYCSCLEDKITQKRKFSEIGAFFIKLGKNENGAVGQLKHYEGACSR